MARDIARRMGSLLLAALFLLTTIAFTAIIYLDARNQNKAADEQAALQEQLNQQQQASGCNIRTPVPSKAEKVPVVYKPEGDVTKLQITDLEKGTGKAAKNGDCLVVKYHGTLASNGEKFDGNFDKETALQFTLGAGDVIKGWDQGMVGIKEGGTRRLVIPSELGYGETGSPPAIPENADLVFVVKLIEIKAVEEE